MTLRCFFCGPFVDAINAAPTERGSRWKPLTSSAPGDGGRARGVRGALDAEGLAKYEALVQQDVERFRRECEERGFDPAELMRGMTTRDVPEKTALSWVRGAHFRG